MELEERQLLTAFTVTNSNDSGPGSLRATLASAPAGATIDFDTSAGHVTSPIKLTSGVLNLTEDVTIDGPASGLVINGNQNGAVFSIYSGVTAAITNLTVTGGSASGVYNDGKLSMTDCAISGNKASGHGGGIYNIGNLSLFDCTVSGNAAGSSYYGGGLYNDDIATLTGCTFSFNTAGEFGGAVYNDFALNAYNSTFVSNSAGTGYYGGGLYNNDDSALVVSCTFTSNSAAYGGGVYGNLSPIMWNTIVAGNTATSGSPDVYGTVYSGGAIDSLGGHNLIGNTAGSLGWGSSDRLNISSPGLAALAFYGGPTATIALQPGSPAIGTGITEFGITKDQRGFPLDSPHPDIGAFQAESGALVVNTTLGTPSVPSGDLGVYAAVNLANSAPVSHTVTFGSSAFATAQTITLASGQLELSNPGGTQTIVGTAAGVTLNGGGTSRVLQIDAGVKASLSGLTITGGNSSGKAGGGLVNSGNLTLINCSVTGNAAPIDGIGGGLENYGLATLTNCTLSANTAGNDGGGLAGNGTTMLVNCAVTGNTSGAGGGLYMSGPTTLTGCTISGNTAARVAGGVGNNESTLTLTNCTISGNTADGGGGVWSDGKLSITSSTITANSGGAQGGGGVFNEAAPATLINSIVAGNTNGSAAASDIGGGITVSGTYNLIGTGGSGGLSNGVGGNIVGIANPGLASLAYYGGPTQTIALTPGSAAIGKGTRPSGVTTDQRGFPLDSPVDIGAFQVDSNPLVVNTTFEGSRVPSGALDLAAAVRLSDLEPGSHTITFDSRVFATPQTIALSSGQLELSNVSGPQTITGPTARVTILASTASRVFQIDAGVTASLSDLTITGGSADQGGDLLNSGNSLTMTNCTVSGGKATKDGGGIASLGTLTMTNSTVSHNNSSNNGGGVASYGAATLTDCTLSSNAANMGGGLFSTNTLSMNGCTVTENGGTQDGGLFSAGEATLTNCSITNDFGNQAGGFGNSGTMTLTDCSITGDSAVHGAGGGGVNNGTLMLNNCDLSADGVGSFGNGGALANYKMATLTNCTVSGNTVGQQPFPGNGGGVQNSAVGTVTFIDCTLSGNNANKGGGLYNLGTATLTNTIVAGNSNYTKGASDIGGSSKVTGTYNLIGTGGSGGLTNGSGGNTVGVSNPGLDSLGPYGGPTKTMALLPGSPAIGEGTVASGVTTDQRGMPRGASVDIGAYQYSLVVESPAGPVDTDPAQLTLTGAVRVANSFDGPVAITFDPAVFTGNQTITLTGTETPLELDSQVPICTITTKGLTAESSITINGTAQILKIDSGVTAFLSGLIIESSTAFPIGLGLESHGTTSLTNCEFIGPARSNEYEGIEVDGGTLNVSQSQFMGWATGIVVNGGTVAITHSAITGNGDGIYTSGANISVTAQYDDLENNTFAGIYNSKARIVNATYDWWGKSSGPNTPGASQAVGNVNFSPWLGDAQSLNLATPDSLGFTSTGSNAYTVTPDPAGLVLKVSLAGAPTAPWSVTTPGTILFSGNGGKVTINGQPKTDAFTITTAAVTFTAADVFKGAAIEFMGGVGREIDAKGTTNSFDVSGWTGSGALSAPTAAGTVSTIVATKSAGFTLTNSALSSTDGMSLTIRGLTTANLTANATSGKPTVIVNASAFTGVTNLAAGGSGNLILYGGGNSAKTSTLTLNSTSLGNDIVIGGPGPNNITDNGSGKSILIGGAGPNTLVGNGNDILIGGTTSYDSDSIANITALDAILAEWSSSDAYATRINKIFNGMIPGGYSLNATTVKSNGKTNTLADGVHQPANQNWFIVTRSDIISAAGDETQTIIP